MLGAKAVIMPKFEPPAFLEATARYGVTFTGGVPAIFTMLLKHRDLIATLDLSKLKGIFDRLGGGAAGVDRSARSARFPA